MIGGVKMPRCRASPEQVIRRWELLFLFLSLLQVATYVTDLYLFLPQKTVSNYNGEGVSSSYITDLRADKQRNKKKKVFSQIIGVIAPVVPPLRTDEILNLCFTPDSPTRIDHSAYSSLCHH